MNMHAIAPTTKRMKLSAAIKWLNPGKSNRKNGRRLSPIITDMLKDLYKQAGCPCKGLYEIKSSLIFDERIRTNPTAKYAVLVTSDDSLVINIISHPTPEETIVHLRLTLKAEGWWFEEF